MKGQRAHGACNGPLSTEVTHADLKELTKRKEVTATHTPHDPNLNFDPPVDSFSLGELLWL